MSFSTFVPEPPFTTDFLMTQLYLKEYDSIASWSHPWLKLAGATWRTSDCCREKSFAQFYNINLHSEWKHTLWMETSEIVQFVQHMITIHADKSIVCIVRDPTTIEIEFITSSGISTLSTFALNSLTRASDD